MTDPDDTNVAVALKKGSDELVEKINEVLAGIPTDKREEMMNDAVWECARNFREYWGQRLVNIVRVLHHLIYSGAALRTDDARTFEQDDRPSWERGQSNFGDE